VCFDFSLQICLKIFLILRRTEWDMIKNLYSCSCKSTRYYFQIIMKLEFSRQIFGKKKFKCQISWKSVLCEPIFVFAQTDMTNLTVAFRNLANTSKNSTWYSHRVNVLCMDLRKHSDFFFLVTTSIYSFCITEMDSVYLAVHRDGQCLPRGTHWFLTSYKYFLSLKG